MKKSGYTLVELIIVMAIAAIVMAALLYFFSGSITSYRSQVGHIFATADMRNQLQRIVDTLRNAQDNQSNGELWLQGGATDNAITVWTSVSGGALQKVQYARSGADLIRTVDGVATTVATRLDLNSNTPLFTYYDSSAALLAEADRTAAAVKTIGISLTLAIPESSTVASQVVATTVTPRQKLQGTASQLGEADGTREVVIELPRGNPPPAYEQARLTIKNMATSEIVTNKQIPIATLNDGRLRSYATKDYAFINYKNADNFGGQPQWYVWLTWGTPINQMSGAVPLDSFYEVVAASSKAHCLGMTLSVALAFSDCAVYTYPWGVPYQPILTYSEGGYTDHVMDIYVKPPVLESFTSSPATGTHGPGSSITITATYDEPIKSNSRITIVLDSGKSLTLSTVTNLTSGKATISGTYTVGNTSSNENSLDLNVESITSQSVTDTYTPSSTRTDRVLPANNLAVNSSIVVDTTVPTAVLPYSPADNAIGESPSANLVIRFSEKVAAVASKNIIIRRGTTVVEAIPATDSRVSISSDGMQATINPNATLVANAYYVRIESGAFKDLAGNAYAGIPSSATEWNFTTQ